METAKDMWELLSNNSFVGALASGLAILFIGWLVSLIVKKYRAGKVYGILKKGLKEKNKTFLPSAYLSAKSGYTQAQIESLCGHHKKIDRNEKQLESWRLS